MKNHAGTGTQGMRWAVTLLVCASVGAGWLGFANSAQPSIPQLPKQMLWAWERPEDLRFLDVQQTGVAFLAGTVLLHGESITVRPRMQPLRVSRGTVLMAVVRIEPDADQPPLLTAEQSERVATVIAELSKRPGVVAAQVDYDAPQSHREFYRGLLNDLRAKLPAETALSITALASWCLGDNWLDGLPVDEAVPMLFQMGPDAMAVRLHILQGRDFTSPLCRGSLGVATNEPLKNLPGGRRMYWFHARPWTAQSAHAALDGAKP